MFGGEPELARQLAGAAFHSEEVAGMEDDAGESVRAEDRPQYSFPDTELTLGKIHNRTTKEQGEEGEPVTVNIKECMEFVTAGVDWTKVRQDKLFRKHRELIRSLVSAEDMDAPVDLWQRHSDGESIMFCLLLELPTDSPN